MGPDEAVGTTAWGRRTGGVLTRREQVTQARQAVTAQLTSMPGGVRLRLVGPRTAGSALATHREPPDSRFTRAALEAARETTAPPVLAHCLRCWLWADLLAQHDAVSADAELLYIACLLHDIGLGQASQEEPAGACFAVRGAAQAAALLREHALPEASIQVIEDAIAAHMNAHVPIAFGVEAHLLHAAAHLDVAGTRVGDLPVSALRSVLAAYPRDDFVATFSDLMHREARANPRSRTGTLWRAGLPVALRLNPLDAVVPDPAQAG